MKLMIACEIYENCGIEHLLNLCKFLNIGCNWRKNELICYFSNEKSFGDNVLAKFDVYEQYYKLNNEKHVLEDFTWICL